MISGSSVQEGSIYWATDFRVDHNLNFHRHETSTLSKEVKQRGIKFCVLLSKHILLPFLTEVIIFPVFRFAFLLAFGSFCCLYRDLTDHNDNCIVIYSAFRPIKHALMHWFHIYLATNELLLRSEERSNYFVIKCPSFRTLTLICPHYHMLCHLHISKNASK